jgi:glycosyltransferase involved in cell wall biosynthesis
MRVLVVHNRYSSRVPSGENLAVDDEVRWLREAGVDAAVHTVSNDDALAPGTWARLRDGANGVWSLPARRRFEDVLDAERPDVVHVHNLFPLLSGSVPAAARRRGLPVVWTVHNHRVRCVEGGNFRDGRPCHDCRAGWRVPGIVHRCYAGSAAASGLVTAASSAFRTSARRRGVLALAVSEHVRTWLVEVAGLDPAAVRVKPNGVAGPSGPVPPPAGSRAFLFLSRLDAGKGVGLLLDAWRRADLDAELHIVGGGDMADEVSAAAAADPRITWTGPVGAETVGEHLARARAVVVPSLWDEPFGRVAPEAFAYGRPVITTGLGGLGEAVDATTGWVTGPEAEAVAAALAEAAGDDGEVSTRGAAARSRWDARYSPPVTTAALVDVYRSVSLGSR